MGLDSVELVIAIEEEFGCSISNADAEKMQTVRNVLDWLVEAERNRRLFLKLSPQSPPAGWWAKLGHVATKYEVKEWWSGVPKPVPRDLIKARLFSVIKEQLGVKEVWEEARFIQDLGMD